MQKAKLGILCYMCTLLCMLGFCVRTSGLEPGERRTPIEPPVPKTDPAPKIVDEESKPSDEDKILVKTLDGVRFIADPRDVVAQDLILFGIEVKGVPVLDDEKFKEQIKPFLGQPITLSSIKKMGKVVILHCRTKGRPFVDISVPEQDITGGVIQLLVREARLGEIRVEGGKYWDAKVYRNAVDMNSGEAIGEKALLQNLDYFNRSAFRKIKPVFKPGKEAGTTDLILQAEERFPVRFYTGYEDTGSQTTGIDRLVAGVNWGNAFFQDHELGYGYATDIDFERLQSHSGYWRIPLPDWHRLSITGGWSKNQATINSDLFNPAVNWQIGLSYQAPFPKLGGYRHQGRAGFDFKQSNNNLEFGGAEVFKSKFDILELSLEYSGAIADPWGRFDFGLTGYFSPGHLTANNTSREFNVARIGTDPQYGYGQLRFERTWTLPKEISLVNRFLGQVSTNRLQSTEQLLLGGHNSVRGYDDRLTASDEGFQLNVELKSPDFLLGKIGGEERYENRLQFLAFYDFGFGYIKDDFAGEQKRVYLESFGGGMRYRLGEHVNVRFDYGRQLRLLKNGAGGDEHGRIHLGVIVSF